MAGLYPEEVLPRTILARDDTQPWIYDDIEKRHEIDGVAGELDDLFDKAVKFASKYLDQKYKIAENIEIYLEYYRGVQSSDDTHHLKQPKSIPDDQWRNIIDLVQGVDVFYSRKLDTVKERKTAVTKLLNAYCHKVKHLDTGCLIATLQLVDDLHLSHLVKGLVTIAKKVRNIIINIDNLKSVADKYAEEKMISEELKDFALEVLIKVTDGVRVQISMEQGQMLRIVETVKSENATLELTMMTKMSGLALPSSSDPDDVDFIDKFKDFEHTYKALVKVLHSREDYEILEEHKPEVEEELKLEDPEEMKKSSSDESEIPKVFVGLLSPPRSSAAAAKSLTDLPKKEFDLSDTSVYIGTLPRGTTERDLFNMCREFGTILSLKIKEETITGSQNGFVDFADASSAQKAIKGLKAELHAQKAEIRSAPPELVEHTLVMRDMSEYMTKENLIEMFSKYGSLVEQDCKIVPPQGSQSFYHGYVRFAVSSDARRALEVLQKDKEFVLMVRGQKEQSLFASKPSTSVDPFSELLAEQIEQMEELSLTPSTFASSFESLSYEFSDHSICIENPPLATTDRTLFDLCRPYGTILNAHAVTDRATSLCRQGFVSFSDSSEAERAIAALSSYNVTKSRKAKTPELSDKTLLFKELPVGVGKDYLRSLCTSYGALHRYNVTSTVQDPNIAYGFVDFVSAEDARFALVDLQSQNTFVIMAFKKKPRLSMPSTL